MKLAFIGGAGLPYRDLVLKLAPQLGGGFSHFTLEHRPLSLDAANQALADGEGPFDYVVSSNVLNAFGHHIKHPEGRAEIFAACAQLLRKGGKAIHVMEKSSDQPQLNLNLSRFMHKSVGQDLIYSFFREEGAMDRHQQHLRQEYAGELARGELVALWDSTGKRYSGDDALKLYDSSLLTGKKYDFATSLMVMHQTHRPHITQKTLVKTRAMANDYQGKFNYHHVPVYVEKPGMGIG